MTATEVAPDLRETPSGWLAVSPLDTYPRIGVAGASQDDARERWEAARASRLELLDTPEPAREELPA